MESNKKSHISGPLPRYRKLYEGDRWQPKDGDEWNTDLPYGGKVYLARQKKPSTWLMTALEACFIIFVIAFLYAAYYHIDHLHMHATRATAYMGAANAQHFMGQRYLHGKGVEKDEKSAQQYFKMAADQGHPHASHNLAVMHLKGMHELPPGEAHRLIQHAAVHGVEEAQDALNNVCVDGGCH